MRVWGEFQRQELCISSVVLTGTLHMADKSASTHRRSKAVSLGLRCRLSQAGAKRAVLETRPWRERPPLFLTDSSWPKQAAPWAFTPGPGAPGEGRGRASGCRQGHRAPSLPRVCLGVLVVESPRRTAGSFPGEIQTLSRRLWAGAPWAHRVQQP